MRILITGGAGFIGANLSLELVKRGHTVTVLDNLSEQVHGKSSSLFNVIRNKVSFLSGDVRSRSSWQKAIKGQDSVIHLAAETGTGQSMYEIGKYTEVNIGGTSLLLDILANEEHTIKKVIVASSRAIYGEGKYRCNQHGLVYPETRSEKAMSEGDFEVKCPKCGETVTILPTDEDSKIHPGSIYGITKQAQEQLILTGCRSLGIPAIAFRYQNVYGPGQSLSNPYTGILSIFSTKIKNGNDINVFEDGKEGRDFVYIDDVVHATALGLENDEVKWEAFNVGSGKLTSVETVAHTLVEAYNDNRIRVKVTGAFRVGDIRSNYADLSKIKSVLGYQPAVNFKDGIRKFTDWVNQQQIEEDRLDVSLREMKKRGLYK